MALSLKTISVGSETGVQDIQSNFTTIKSAVDNTSTEEWTISGVTPINGGKLITDGASSNVGYKKFKIDGVNFVTLCIRFSGNVESKLVQLPFSVYGYNVYRTFNDLLAILENNTIALSGGSGNQAGFIFGTFAIKE